MPHSAHPAIKGSPSAETAVWFLIGLMWQYIPHRFIFEEFEVSPRLQKYGHTKFLDARGKEWQDGKWVDVNFEFKLNSSGVLGDLKKHPDFHATWLVCWKHDAPAAEQYVDRVLCLEDIYNNLPDEVKRSMIIDPHQIVKRNSSGLSVAIPELVERFCAINRPKVQLFIDLWPHEKQGNASEIILMKSGRPQFRLCAYSSEHVLVKAPLPEATVEWLVECFGAEQMSVNEKVKISLHKLDLEAIDEIITSAVQRSSKRAPLAKSLLNMVTLAATVLPQQKSDRFERERILNQFKALGVARDKKNSLPGTLVCMKWLLKAHIVEIRYKYKMGWEFEGYYIDGNLVPLPKLFGSRKEAEDFYCLDAYHRLISPNQAL